MRLHKDDLVPGLQLERLTLIELVSFKQRKHWRCACTCGNEVMARPKDFVRLLYKSCGCLRRTQFITHGMSYSHEYGCWQAMIARCENPNLPRYKDYGGRGITVFPAWRKDFSVFFKDMGPCQKTESLDRIDPNKGCSPDNCRWASLEVQANNRRTTVRYMGKTVREWSNELGVPYEAMKKRLRRYGRPKTIQLLRQ